jgi:hypothetical protein
MPSHTGTGEWKSFEIRMRHRRAERLLLRADVAAHEGCLDDARAALDEAKTLWPAAPGLDDVQRHIETTANPPIPLVVPSRHLTWLEFAAAASVVACLAAAAATLLMRMPNALRARDVGAFIGAPLVDDPTSVRPASAPLPGVSTTELPPVADDDAPTVVQDVTLENSERVQPASAPAQELPRLDLVRSTPVQADPAQSDAVRPEPVREPERPEPVKMETPIATSGFSAPAQPLPELAVAPAMALAAPTVAVKEPAASAANSTAAVTSPPQSALVRDALTGYAKAYSDLNVGEATRVWPTVDRAALARAFDQLDSQQISLGICHLEIDGSTAQANCLGTATWKPKVGSGERTDRRSWTFDLQKAADGWQIVNARVQNR